MMTDKELLSALTLEEKILLLTGGSGMGTYAVPHLGINAHEMADGPHGVRFSDRHGNCTLFPCLTAVCASWDEESSAKMGEGIADDCIKHDISMILGPGVNIKKNILCGRNFEYFSEDPVLTGNMASGYVNGLQEKGVSACVKHYAANNQEIYRETQSSEVDERTLREIYLKAFEIIVKKSNPAAIMCGYNKVNSVWCSENRFLLTEVLKDEWGYRGMVVSDWGAVHDICRAVMAGLDLEMPQNPDIVSQVKKGLAEDKITAEAIDSAVLRVLKFVNNSKPAQAEYDRYIQHKMATDVAASGIVLLENKEKTLPLTSEKYKKIAVIGEFAYSPLIGGQGSAEVYPDSEFVDSPYAELKKRLPNTEFSYMELYQTHAYSKTMLWPKFTEFLNFVKDSDLVLIFAGAMESEDTEKFDRRSASLNPNYELFIDIALSRGKKVAVVLQSGSALILGDWADNAHAVLEMWLAGEGAGSAIADVLSGKVNPSGKLPETFPKCHRHNFEYPGTRLKVSYDEKLNVGYRYYDKHTEEIRYPFGHGLSYTDFVYKNASVLLENEEINVSLELENVGEYDGAEVVQVYIGDPTATVTKPIKELKAFKKVFVKNGETKKVNIRLPLADIAYYNIMLHEWVVENGRYDVYIASSSQDIREKLSFVVNRDMPYSMQPMHESMIGDNSTNVQ